MSNTVYNYYPKLIVSHKWLHNNPPTHPLAYLSKVASWNVSPLAVSWISPSLPWLPPLMSGRWWWTEVVDIGVMLTIGALWLSWWPAPAVCNKLYDIGGMLWWDLKKGTMSFGCGAESVLNVIKYLILHFKIIRCWAKKAALSWQVSWNKPNYSPVLKVGTLATVSESCPLGERGVATGSLCMDRGSLRSQRTIEPSSLPAKASEDFCGLKQQQVGDDSQQSTLCVCVWVCSTVVHVWVACAQLSTVSTFRACNTQCDVITHSQLRL